LIIIDVSLRYAMPFSLMLMLRVATLMLIDFLR